VPSKHFPREACRLPSMRRGRQPERHVDRVGLSGNDRAADFDGLPRRPPDERSRSRWRATVA
jgi:hypothetical protein